MSESFLHSTEIKNSDALSSDERRLIESLANIRRRRISLNTSLRTIEIPDTDEAKQRHEKILRRIMREASGKGEILSEDKDEAAIRAKEFETIAQNASTAQEAAFNFARAAQVLCAASDPLYDNLLQKAKKEAVSLSPAAKINIGNLWADAIILGIEDAIVKSSSMPSPKRVASHILTDTSLLKDYALVLSEDERDKFIGAFPNIQQKKISTTLDVYASSVLKESIIATDDEKAQRLSVQIRAGDELLKGITLPGEGETKSIIKELAEILKSLEGEDSKRLLKNLGERGLAGLKDKEKNRLRISYVARVIAELASIDRAAGASLAMKFLGSKEIPARFFSFFLSKLIEGDFITEKTQRYLENKKHLPFLRKLIAEYPNQFNTAIDTLSSFPNYDPSDNQSEVFQALRDLDAVTPIIFDRYRKADAKGKKALAEQIHDLKPKFFRNLAIGTILQKKDRDILVEMVYLAYKPINMSFESVARLMEKPEDRTKDIEKFSFPEDGYPFELKSQKTYRLKQGENLDMRKIHAYRSLFTCEYPQKEEDIKKIALHLERLAKADTDFKADDLSELMSLLSGDQMIRGFSDEFRDVTHENGFLYLTGLRERLGVYFDDNYSQRLLNFFGQNPAVEAKLQKLLANPKRIETLRRKLAKDGEDITWDELTSREELAKMVATFVSSKVMKGLKEEIARQMNKFEEGDHGAVSERTHANLRAYMSKNIGSFFAKASAGICTAEDMSLFKRSDHFHINIVENDERVRANIQAYIISDQGKQSLVLRGFNPTEDFLKTISPGPFCETVIEIARQFQRDNNFHAVYITESLGNWHALSNREKVQEYLVRRYCKDKKRKSHHLQIAESKSIGSIYEI